MSVGSTSDRLLGFLRPLRKPNGLPPLAMADKVVDSSESDSPVVARLQELLSGPQTAGVVYQSVIVACLRAIYRARLREEQLARASISLGQKRKIATLLDRSEEHTSELKSRGHLV